MIDVCGFRRWSLPLAAVGANSIAIYLMAQLMKPFVAASLRTHFGREIFDGPERTTRERTLRSGRVLADLPVALQAQDLHQDLNWRGGATGEVKHRDQNHASAI